MNCDNISPTSSITSTISSTFCNECETIKNRLNNKNYSLLKYHQITTAQSELISAQRSLTRELLKNSKEFREKFGIDYNVGISDYQEKEGVGCDVVQTDVDSIRDEICFVKSIRELAKGTIKKPVLSHLQYFSVI